MRAFHPMFVLFACALLLAPPLAVDVDAQGRGGIGGRGRTAGRPVPPQLEKIAPLAQRGGQEPAYARGYSNGYQRGRSDATRGERYDPANSREYRDADDGYSDSYGSRDGYRTNYRAGFRKGYEDGYRSVQR